MTKSLSAQWSQIQRKLADFATHAHDHPHGSGWTPNTDVCESLDNVMVKMELAGVSREDVHIFLQEQHLVVEGIRRDPYGGESTAGYKFLQMEIEYGHFRRVVHLPYAVDGEKTRAQYDNGILKISLPRAAKARSVKIDVELEG